MTKNTFKKKWPILILVLIIGVIIGKFTGSESDNSHVEDTHEHVDGKEEQLWTCSMHPQIKQNGPGQCPLCGMDLIPLDDSMSDDESLPNEVPMSESSMKLAEIQTYVVKLEKPEKEIRLLGKVKADERLMYSQAVHFPGRVEKLFVNFTGEKVVKGQKLATVYSSELVTAQKELFEVLKEDSTNPILVDAARNKLKQWKFNDQQIANLEKSGKVQTDVDILSEYDGYVIMRMVSEGDHFKEGQVLFEITDLSKVWVLFEAYENDLPWIKLGDKFDIELKSIPGKTFKSEVSFIDPFISPKTRVAYVRVEMRNKNEQFKPDMFASGIITSKLSINNPSILIPKSAVLWTGKRAVVYVKVPNREHNTFIYKEVILGEDAGDFYIVNNGLDEGEEIVSNGVFKIDASAQLAGKKSMMNPTGGKVATGHNHGGSKDNKKPMDMSKMDMSKEITIDKSIIPEEFKQQLSMVVKNYLLLKDKLANDDSNTKTEAKNVKKSISNVDMTLVMSDAHNLWMKTLKSMNKDLDLLEAAVNIDEQRSHFLNISNSLSTAVQRLGVKLEKGKVLYVEFCEMADNNKGGSWLSLDKEIANPYFGQKMSKCGEVKMEIRN